MISETSIIILLAVKCFFWLYVLSYRISNFKTLNLSSIYIKVSTVLRFYLTYITDLTTVSKRKIFMNVWSSGKFADTYWFVYSKSLNSRENY